MFKTLLLLFSVILITNNSFAEETPMLICKNDKEVFFIKGDAIYYILIGEEKLGVHNGFIAKDTEGNKRLLLQNSKEETCVIDSNGKEV